MIAAHNRWASRVTTSSSGRLRPVAIVLTDTLEQMMIGRDHGHQKWGASGGNASRVAPQLARPPADRALDPFWDLFAAANVPSLCPRRY